MQRTILSRKELNILEKIITSFGNIVYFEDIKKLFGKEYSLNELRKQISLLSKRGWLVRIKQGVFAVASLESHNFANIFPLVISSIFVSDSYVSFEAALNHYGLFDQLSKKVTAVTSKRPKKFSFQDMEYHFVKIKPELYFGYQEIAINSHKAKVAELEKVILDYLYFRVDTYSVDLVLEKLRENKNDFDFEKMQKYGLKYTLTVKRRLGFLLDLIEIDSDKLLQEVKKYSGYSRLTKKSNKFNAKWRIYYENQFAR